MAYTVESDFTTKAGLRAVVIKVSMGHRCGYVGVEESSSLFKVGYSQQIPDISQESVQNTYLGNKSLILILGAMADSDGEGLIRRSLDIIIDVHEGLTYSGGDREYPVPSALWWFGFDTAHYLDVPELGGQPLDYCINECERLAEQLVALERKE